MRFHSIILQFSNTNINHTYFLSHKSIYFIFSIYSIILECDINYICFDTNPYTSSNTSKPAPIILYPHFLTNSRFQFTLKSNIDHIYIAKNHVQTSKLSSVDKTKHEISSLHNTIIFPFVYVKTNIKY